VKSIVRWSNLGLAKKTWCTYKTAERMLKKCSLETGVSMELPMNNKQTLAFIDWLARVRNLKCTTINSYLAGIRQLHISKGLTAPELRTDIVQLVLKGIANSNGIDSRRQGWSGRLPHCPKTFQQKFMLARIPPNRASFKSLYKAKIPYVASVKNFCCI
jgi:hypothetical protein